MSKKTKISDLKYDDKNFNKGTEYGKMLMEKSLKKFGAGRSILIDKNNKIIAGNKTTENFGELGFENVQIVETDGKTLIAVRRNDIDLDTPEGREFAASDNQTAKVNIDFDFEVLESELEQGVLDEWGLDVCQEAEIDYSLLDGEDEIDTQLQDMANGVKKAIQIEFEPDHYQEAYDLVKFWREQDAYVGKMILDFLKAEKNKL